MWLQGLQRESCVYRSLCLAFTENTATNIHLYLSLQPHEHMSIVCLLHSVRVHSTHMHANLYKIHAFLDRFGVSECVFFIISYYMPLNKSQVFGIYISNTSATRNEDIFGGEDCYTEREKYERKSTRIYAFSRTFIEIESIFENCGEMWKSMNKADIFDDSN